MSQCNICEKGYSGSNCDQCGDGFHKKNDQCEGELIAMKFCFVINPKVTMNLQRENVI